MSNKVVTCKNAEMWNKSISMFFNRTPKIDIWCGECGHYFSRRFSLDEIDSDGVYAICPECKAINNIPIKFS